MRSICAGDEKEETLKKNERRANKREYEYRREKMML
jgi:hypothetical protein